jgi:uncharacterized protein
VISLRVYGALNDFLRPVLRHATLVCDFAGGGSVKDCVEALGVPHPEIDLIVVNNQPVAFTYRVCEGDRIAVYPPFRMLDLGDVPHLCPPAQARARFIADVHLGRLTAYLRLAGFDTEYRNDYSDSDIAGISASDDRAVLTRDVGLLKHRVVTRGYFLRQTHPASQLIEVLRRFDLAGQAAPFSRCVRCNETLRQVPKDRIEHLLPPRTREQYRDFSRCPACARIFWQGSHYARMSAFLEIAFAQAGG